MKNFNNPSPHILLHSLFETRILFGAFGVSNQIFRKEKFYKNSLYRLRVWPVRDTVAYINLEKGLFEIFAIITILLFKVITYSVIKILAVA